MHYQLFLRIRLYCCCVTKKKPHFIQTRYTNKCVNTGTAFFISNLSAQAHLNMTWENITWSKNLIKDKTSVNCLIATLDKHVENICLVHNYNVRDNDDAKYRLARRHGHKIIKPINTRSLKSWCPWAARQNSYFLYQFMLVVRSEIAGWMCVWGGHFCYGK